MTTTEHADGKGHSVHTSWSVLADESHSTDLKTLTPNQTDILRMHEERCKSDLLEGKIEAWRREITHTTEIVTHRIFTR